MEDERKPQIVGQELRELVMRDAQGAVRLAVAFVGVSAGLFEQLDANGPLTADKLAKAAQRDAGYVQRWCDAAYAFELLDETGGRFQLSGLGQAFVPTAPGTLMPFAIQDVLSAHMAERAAGLMLTGERPGESVLAERPAILPWFGPMLEAQFGPIFEKTIMPGLKVYEEAALRQGLVVDLGCGNGWYLLRLAARFPGIRCLGVDGFEENIRQARARAAAQGVAERVTFVSGDIYSFENDEKADIIALNRALHHVWDEKKRVFSLLKAHLKSQGSAVIWEPHWPHDRHMLRQPTHRMMAFQNLTEHIQGNHFLMPAEIAEAFGEVGLAPAIYSFLEGREAVVIGTRA